MPNDEKPHNKADRWDIEEKSDLEEEGGMRTTEPGHLGEDRVTDLADEVNELEGHNLEGHTSRDAGSRNAGAQADLGPESWTGADLDRRRRAAKRAENAHGRDPREEQRQVDRYAEPT